MKYREVTIEQRRQLTEYLEKRERQVIGPPLKYNCALYMVKGENARVAVRGHIIVSYIYNCMTKQ